MLRRLMLGFLSSALLLAACARPASPPSARAPAAPPPESVDAAAYRQQVIDGARTEGTAHILLSPIWTDDTLRLVEDAIERQYGVRIKISRTPTNNYPVHATTLMSELAANVTPSYDLHQSSDSSSAMLLNANALEPVNWQALVPAGTPPEVIQGDNRLLASYTAYNGLWYDPTQVAESEVPRSLKDLASPRWRGKVGLAMYPNYHMPYLFTWGRDETLSTLRAIMQNGAFVGTFFDIDTRIAAKEIAMGTVNSLIYNSARMRGMPGGFTLMDIAPDAAHHLSVPRRAARPYAAKLIAATIAGPAGQRIAAEHIGVGNRYYSGSSEQRLTDLALAHSLPPFSWFGEPGALDFLLSPAGEELTREIGTILQGG